MMILNQLADKFWFPLLYQITAMITRTISTILCFDIQVTGFHNIPKEGAYVLVSNHVGHLDPYLLATIFPKKIYFMANPAQTPALRVLAGLDANQTIQIKSYFSIRKAMKLISENKVVGFFPEAARNENGTPIHPKAGAAFLALVTNANILPVKITGTGEALNYRTKRVRPGSKLRFSIDKPISVEPFRHSRRLKVAAEELMRYVMERITALE